MGAEESKSAGSSGTASFASGAIDFPNSCRRESNVTAWTLLHQCTNEKWKEGHAGKQGGPQAKIDVKFVPIIFMITKI